MMALLLAYDAVAVAAWILLYHRAGFPDVRTKHNVDWREFLLPNLPWFFLLLLKIMFWPAPLAVWLVNGRPKESAWRAVTEVEGRPVRRIVRLRASSSL
ncbi:MAG: hypothetical protein QOC82_2960 [Frankiaceae bacterium]|jgi:hypothetical protein|nr:hypothetical protein [Frankiaceae bacterium]